MMSTLYKKIMLIIGLITLLTSCCDPDFVSMNKTVDANRLVGDWYTISNIPYFAERNKVGGVTSYTKTGSNKYQEIYSARDGGFDREIETFVGTTKSLNANNTKWKSTFYWVINFDYEILDVDDNYQTLLLGHRSRNYGWLMARNKRISDEQYRAAMQVFTNNGYDIAQFAKIPQYPEDIGKLGFQRISN